MTDYFPHQLSTSRSESAATDSRTGWNCRRLREKTVLKCSAIPKDLHTRLCARHWEARFGFIESRRHIGEMILGEDFYGSQGEHYFWPKEYSSAKTAQKRIGKLEAAGMRCELTGCNSGYIRLLGYTPEMESSLERERQDMPRHTGSGCQNTGISPNTGTVHQNISNPIRQIQL